MKLTELDRGLPRIVLEPIVDGDAAAAETSAGPELTLVIRIGPGNTVQTVGVRGCRQGSLGDEGTAIGVEHAITPVRQTGNPAAEVAFQGVLAFRMSMVGDVFESREGRCSGHGVVLAWVKE